MKPFLYCDRCQIVAGAPCIRNAPMFFSKTPIDSADKHPILHEPTYCPNPYHFIKTPIFAQCQKTDPSGRNIVGEYAHYNVNVDQP